MIRFKDVHCFHLSSALFNIAPPPNPSRTTTPTPKHTQHNSHLPRLTHPLLKSRVAAWFPWKQCARTCVFGKCFSLAEIKLDLHIQKNTGTFLNMQIICSPRMQHVYCCIIRLPRCSWDVRVFPTCMTVQRCCKPLRTETFGTVKGNNWNIYSCLWDRVLLLLQRYRKSVLKKVRCSCEHSN